MKALYAYFMHGVAPVEHENRAVDIVWPLSMRWPLGIWRKMFAPTPKPFDAAPYTDPVVARGAYLVQPATAARAIRRARRPCRSAG